ncbi:hypothetical protein B484DRAFT_235649, partial [Ochromonadaceae sp. CCMP2298]
AGAKDEEGGGKKKKEKVDVVFDIAPSVSLVSREEEERLANPPEEGGGESKEGKGETKEGEMKEKEEEEKEKEGPPEAGVEGEEGEGEEGEGEDKDEMADVPVSRVRWMYETAEEGWKVYSSDASAELEGASRDGKTDYTLTLGGSVHKCKLETKKQTRDDADGEFRIRRHVLGEGLAGTWEVLTMKFERPQGLYGSAVLKILEKVWSLKETMDGKQCGLGFMFLYSLFTGDCRVKVAGGGYEGGKSAFAGPYKYKSGSSSNDSHRFALLLTQLFVDKHSKSLPASVLNVLGRNRQVSLRMPKFKDSRKAQQTPFLNGWVDDTEPRSPLAELFSKLVPQMDSMKRKGAFHFPPPPPHLELPSPPTVGILQPASLPNWERPELSDYGCEERTLSPIGMGEVAQLIANVRYRLGETLTPRAPIHIEDSAHFDAIISAAPTRLYIVAFHAAWCEPCRSLTPVYRLLSLQTPTAGEKRI